MMTKLILLTGMLLSLPIAGLYSQELEAQKLERRITDRTGILTRSELEALERKLAEFEQATSTQVVVLIVGTTGNQPIEEAAIAVAEANGIGKKEKNNGILLLIAKNDRQMRIEVGYGLEGAVTDALAGQIIRREIIPRFREGNYFAGIDAGIDAIIKATRNEYKAEKNKDTSPVHVVPLLMIIFVIVFLARGGRRYRRSPWGMGPPFYSGWGGGSSGGGGFGGGGFSGGGGSFGGGGASGKW